MTLLTDDVVEAAAPKRSRRRWVVGAAVVLAVAVIGAGAGWLEYARHYQPLRAGQVSAAPYGHMKAITDGVTDPTALILVGKAGVSGTAFATIHNSGHFGVRIEGLQPNDLTTMTLRWQPEARIVNGHRTPSWSPAHSRPLPVSVPPGGEVVLYLTATKPHCGSGLTEELTQLDLKARVLGLDEVLSLPLEPGAADVGAVLPPIDVCSPASALRHLSPRNR